MSSQRTSEDSIKIPANVVTGSVSLCFAHSFAPGALSDLDENGIGDEGLTRLAASLPQLLSLLQLSLLSLNTKTAFPKQLSGFPKHYVA